MINTIFSKKSTSQQKSSNTHEQHEKLPIHDTTSTHCEVCHQEITSAHLLPESTALEKDACTTYSVCKGCGQIKGVHGF